jgi:DNA-binding IclR family transcriptional regulator
VTTLAEAMQCNVSHASRQVRSLIERGQLSRMPDGSLALGAGGTFVNVPREIASQLADFCAARGERLSDTLRDAIVLHMDQATAAEE